MMFSDSHKGTESGAASHNQHSLPSGAACWLAAWHLPLHCLSLQACSCNLMQSDTS